MSNIKFSHTYEKMPKGLFEVPKAPTSLLAVFVDDTKNFCEFFVKYDTFYSIKEIEKSETHNFFYPLPKGKVIVLLLITHNDLWTTIRRWTPQKEAYYRGRVGTDFEIIINNGEEVKK